MTKNVRSAATGDVLFSQSDAGSVRTQNLDRLNVKAGVDADGMSSHMARNAAMIGVDRDTAEVGIIGAQTGSQIVSSLAGAFTKFRATTEGLREEFPGYERLFGSAKSHIPRQ